MMQSVFRFRALIFFLLYLLGFLAPWEGDSNVGARSSLWLAASTLLSRSGWISLSTATLAVTSAALVCIVLGAIMRLSGTAYLGASTMAAARMHGNTVLAAGPYRYLRNPLYLGGWLLGVGVSVLMPPAGAIFFLIALTLMYGLLIRSEERFLSARLGFAYEEYCRSVPRLLPRIVRPRDGKDAASGTEQAHPHWLAAVLAEIYPLGLALCFAVFAWRYNAQILIKCLLICYGLSLIGRALRPRTAPAAPSTAQ